MNIVFLFYRDLRLFDNPSLLHLSRQATKIYPLYIYDPKDNQLGEAGRLWLEVSLKDLNQKLNRTLAVISGSLLEVVPDIVKKNNIDVIGWNHSCEPGRSAQYHLLKKMLNKKGVDCYCDHASLLWPPGLIKNKKGDGYRVFTPFYKKALSLPLPKKPDKYCPISDRTVLPLGVEQYRCKHSLKNWEKKLLSFWKVGEDGAQQALKVFCRSGLLEYCMAREYPGLQKTSFLSPYLHFGQISVRQVWHEVQHHSHIASQEVCAVLRQLIWRDFAYAVLHQYPDLNKQPIHEQFNYFEWTNNKVYLERWKKGLTGYPIIDAGMRELYQTGFMHNRVRMIVASFLVKNLNIDWRLGASWFWDCLVDADLASNGLNWQWVAGCGVDPSPYYRIFNPILQGKKFDPDGHYVCRWLPELQRLNFPQGHAPWLIDKVQLLEADVFLGDNYPKPIVDLRQSRDVALKLFQDLKFKKNKLL
jgi:deoxyribodipyrimidine photo-lyase